jgi:RimJ/RimL family protein N-acetyltransferase/nitroimidazol reductase NimA-like FMN-containing flavoprotein (pyridoxamine 5'-phosphate oxidase superfamily)
MSDALAVDQSAAYPASALTTPSRYPERATYERAAAHEVLDGAYVCHLGFVVDGAPRVLPTLFVRVGDMIYLHGSTAATPWLAARRDGGLPIVVEVTEIDALILARSQFHHSANYRSVVAHGVGRLVTDEPTKRAAMTALVDKIGATLAGHAGAPADAVEFADAEDAGAGALPDDLRRSLHSRPPTAAELAKTAVVALELRDVSVKRRTGGVDDDEADLGLPYWAGVVPLRSTPGAAEPADGVMVPAPPYVPTASSWRTPVRLSGWHVELEPLSMAHAPELYEALDDAEVWRHIPTPQPGSVEDMSRIVAAALDDSDQVPWLQRDAITGEAIGTTSYHAINEAAGRLAIGWTMVARPRWRSAVNTEAKLLLMRYAFETLGARRLEFYTDIRNERSQAAIARLGATREGVLRAHRLRGDGSWRDSVIFSILVNEWPSVQNHLASRLAAHETV